MQDGYSNALGSPGAMSGEIEISIQEYRARDGVARVLLGVMAGKDRIVASATINGAPMSFDDSARSAICGIECVASNVGAKIAGAVAPDQVKAVREAKSSSL